MTSIRKKKVKGGLISKMRQDLQEVEEESKSTAPDGRTKNEYFIH